MRRRFFPIVLTAFSIIATGAFSYSYYLKDYIDINPQLRSHLRSALLQAKKGHHEEAAKFYNIAYNLSLKLNGNSSKQTYGIALKLAESLTNANYIDEAITIYIAILRNMHTESIKESSVSVDKTLQKVGIYQLLAELFQRKSECSPESLIILGDAFKEITLLYEQNTNISLQDVLNGKSSIETKNQFSFQLKNVAQSYADALLKCNELSKSLTLYLTVIEPLTSKTESDLEYGVLANNVCTNLRLLKKNDEALVWSDTAIDIASQEKKQKKVFNGVVEKLFKYFLSSESEFLNKNEYFELLAVSLLNKALILHEKENKDMLLSILRKAKEAARNAHKVELMHIADKEIEKINT